MIDRLREIAQNVRTQDNRCTADPMFAVQEEKEICGFEEGYADYYVYYCSEEDHRVVREGERGWKALERLSDNLNLPDRWVRLGCKKEWEFVTACFTEAGCDNYIRLNKHNHKGKLRTYAYGSYRNYEWQDVRHFLSIVGA